jgi:hypothetical protein
MDPRVVAALAIAVGASLWSLVTSIRIQEFLRRRGREVNPLWLCWMIFTCIDEYRQITRRELGRPGLLYTHFMTSWLMALASAVCGVVIMKSG